MLIEVLNPRAVLQSEPVTGLLAPRPASLDGKRIAILCERFPAFFDALEQMILKRYPTATFLRLPSPSSPMVYIDPIELAGKCDVWLEGVKTTGSSKDDFCVTLEKNGLPGVHFTVDDLLPQRKRVALTNGLPTLRLVSLSAEDVFSCEGKPEKLRAIAEAVFDETLAALTSPLTEAEKNPQQLDYYYGPIKFEGKSCEEANEKFQQYFCENDMGDGLALVPPTAEAVKWMLSGTSRSPQEVLGIMTPRDGLATVEKVAVNAVMAGAKPEYLPVIIAAVEALVDKSFDLYHIQTGTLNSRVVIWVNGPITKEIGMNCREGFLGPGNRANSSIGRAVSLCMINIGWCFFKDEVGMLGQPARYCNLIFAENEGESTWESFAVEHGFSEQDSTVTLDECVFTERRGPGGGMACRPLEQDMKSLSDMVRGYLPGLAPVHWHDGMTFAWNPENLINSQYFITALYPTFARQLAKAGYTKQAFAQWLCDQHRISFDVFNDEQKKAIVETAKKGIIPGLSIDDCKPGGTVPTINAKHLALLVVGPMCGQTIGFYGGAGTTMHEDNPGAPIVDFMTKRIHGATLTKAGR